MKRNGFRNQFIALHPFVKLQIGSRFALFCLFMVTMNWIGAAIALFAPILSPATQLLGFKAQFDKTGLSGDELKLIEKLETRMKDFPDAPNKTDLVKEVRATILKDFVDEEGKPTFDINKLKEMLGDDDKGIRSIVIKQGEKLAELAATGGKKSEDLSIRASIAAWAEKNKGIIEAIRSGEKRDLPPLEIRAAASPMTAANTLTNTITVNAGVVPQFESGVRDLRRIKPTFWDYIPKGRTSQAAYSWVNKKVDADTGEAAFIGPGVAKPGISFRLEREVSNAKKIAVSGKLTTELLQDVDGMDSMMRGEMAYRLKSKGNTTMMTGVLSATVPAGIQTISVPYSLVGVETTNPNNFDVIRAAVAQLSVGFFQGLPVTVFINPVDAANMDLTKAVSQGTYLLPPFSTADGRQIAGALVIEDNNIPAGSFQAACLDLFNFLIYKDFTVTLGWENDDFTKNLITYVAEMRIHSFHSDNDAGAFIFDTFANVKTLIEAA